MRIYYGNAKNPLFLLYITRYSASAFCVRLFPRRVIIKFQILEYAKRKYHGNVEGLGSRLANILGSFSGDKN